MTSRASPAVFWVRLSKGSSNKKRKVNKTGTMAKADLSAGDATLLIGKNQLLGRNLKNNPLKGAVARTRIKNNVTGTPLLALQDTPRAAAQPVTMKPPAATDKDEEEKKKAEEKEKEEKKQAELQRQVDEQAKKNAKKKELHAARLNAARDPLVQSSKWTAGCAKLLVELAKALRQTKNSSRIPGNSGPTYNKTLGLHDTKIKDARTKIEAAGTIKSKLRPVLIEANKAVTDANNDLKAWKLLYKGYYEV